MDRGRTNAGGAKFCSWRPATARPKSCPFKTPNGVSLRVQVCVLERGKSGTAACAWSRYIHNFVPCDTASLNQDNAIRQTYGFGNIMGDEHCGKAAALPDVFDELLHFDTRERVEGAQRFVQKQKIRVMDKSSRKCHPLTLPAR